MNNKIFLECVLYNKRLSHATINKTPPYGVIFLYCLSSVNAW